MDRLRVGVGRAPGAVRRGLVGPLVLLLDRADLLLGEGAPLDEEAAEAGERVQLACGGELLLVAVELVPVGVGVGADPHAVGVDEDAPRAALGELRGLAQGADRVEDVLAVAVDDLEVREAREVVRGVVVRGLLPLRDRDAVAVVLDDEDDRELSERAAVDRLVEVPLGGGRLAHRAVDEALHPVRPDRPAEARRVLRVVGDAGGDVPDVEVVPGEVVRHVPAARGDVGGLRHAVEEDLLGGDARREAGRQVAVVGEEVVERGAEDRPEGDLDPVVAGARGVVGPAEALLEVVRGLVVEDAAHVHEGVPLPELLARRVDGGEGGGDLRGGQERFGQGRPPGPGA